MENQDTGDKQDNFFLKIAGKVNVPTKVEIGHNYKLVADCSVISEQRNDNEDGTFDFVSKVVPITVEISKDNGPIIKAKDPRRNSQLIRNYLWKMWHDDGSIEDFEEVYHAATLEIMSEMPRIYREAIKRIENNR